MKCTLENMIVTLSNPSVRKFFARISLPAEKTDPLKWGWHSMNEIKLAAYGILTAQGWSEAADQKPDYRSFAEFTIEDQKREGFNWITRDQIHNAELYLNEPLAECPLENAAIYVPAGWGNIVMGWLEHGIIKAEREASVSSGWQLVNWKGEKFPFLTQKERGGNMRILVEKTGNWIVEHAVTLNFITPVQAIEIETAADATRTDMVTYMLSQKLITPAQIAQIQAMQFGVEVISLKDLEIPADVIALLPKGFARTHGVIPVSKKDGVVTFVVNDPSDLNTIDSLSHLVQDQEHICIAPCDEFEAALQKYYPLK